MSNLVDSDALASFWSITNPLSISSRTFQCGQYYILGGYSLLGPNTIIERTYNALPPHSYISYTLKGFQIDQWTLTDTITVYIDDAVIRTLSPYIDTSGSSTSYCGSPQADYKDYAIVGVQPHLARSLKLKYVFSNSGYSSATYGIRGIAVLIRTVTPTVTSRVCHNAPASLSAPCNCYEHQYTDSTGFAQNCDASCGFCYGPGNGDCFACKSGYFFDGRSCLQCDPSCSSCSGPRANECVTCLTGQLLQQDNNTCTNLCNPPYISQGNGDFKVCSPPCKSSEYISYDSAGQIVCQQSTLNSALTDAITSSVGTSQMASSAVSRILLLVAPKSSGLLFSGCLADMLKYIRYMHINYSADLVQLFKMKSLMETITNKDPSKKDIVARRFVDHPLPERFEEYKQHSSFLANSWKWLITLTSTIIVVIINSLLKNADKPAFIRTAHLKIKAIFHWNYCISTFVTYYGSLVFYSSLEFLTAPYCDTSLEIFSLSVCVLMNIIAVMFLIRLVTIINSNKSSSPPSETLSPEGPSTLSNSHSQGYEIIFDSQKTLSWLQRSYFLIYICVVYSFSTQL